MALLSEYLEGIMKVPLSLLTSDGFAECPLRFSQQADLPDFEDFLAHQRITGIVNPETLDDMLRSLGIAKARFHETLESGQPPCLNHVVPIHCLLASDIYTDGEIYQQVSRHMGTGRLGLADQWLDKLQEGKRKHLAALLGHPQIMEAMKTVLPFVGLWEEFLLGNWAKHLAAHCDELVGNYWAHISQTWSTIFRQLEHLRHLADAQTVRHLRYKAPAWSTLDRDEIEEGFEDGSLFPNVQREHDRAILKRNVLSLRCIIPSIRTFDENMRYLTIAAKILEKRIEVKPKRRRKGPTKSLANNLQVPENLFNNLRKDWHSHRQFCEVAEGQFCEVRDDPSPNFAFLQLFLIAWRKFPHLSTETPLQDTKGIGIVAFLDDEEEARLCSAAYALGFSNSKIEAKINLDLAKQPRRAKHKKTKTSEWRGGKPTIRTLKSLHKSAFYPQLLRQHKARKNPEPVCIQADIVRAFFGYWTIDSGYGASDLDDPNNPSLGFDEIIRQRRHAQPPRSSQDAGSKSNGRSRNNKKRKDKTSENNRTRMTDGAGDRLPEDEADVPDHHDAQPTSLEDVSMESLSDCQDNPISTQTEGSSHQKSKLVQRRRRREKNRRRMNRSSTIPEELYPSSSAEAETFDNPRLNPELPPHITQRSSPPVLPRNHTEPQQSSEPRQLAEQDPHHTIPNVPLESAQTLQPEPPPTQAQYPATEQDLPQPVPSVPLQSSRRSYPEPPHLRHQPQTPSPVTEQVPQQSIPDVPLQSSQRSPPQLPFPDSPRSFERRSPTVEQDPQQSIPDVPLPTSRRSRPEPPLRPQPQVQSSNSINSPEPRSSTAEQDPPQPVPSVPLQSPRRSPPQVPFPDSAKSSEPRLQTAEQDAAPHLSSEISPSFQAESSSSHRPQAQCPGSVNSPEPWSSIAEQDLPQSIPCLPVQFFSRRSQPEPPFRSQVQSPSSAGSVSSRYGLLSESPTHPNPPPVNGLLPEDRASSIPDRASQGLMREWSRSANTSDWEESSPKTDEPEVDREFTTQNLSQDFRSCESTSPVLKSKNRVSSLYWNSSPPLPQSRLHYHPYRRPSSPFVRVPEASFLSDPRRDTAASAHKSSPTRPRSELGSDWERNVLDSYQTSIPQSSPVRPRSELDSDWENDFLNSYQPKPKRQRVDGHAIKRSPRRLQHERPSLYSKRWLRAWLRTRPGSSFDDNGPNSRQFEDTGPTPTDTDWEIPGSIPPEMDWRFSGSMPPEIDLEDDTMNLDRTEDDDQTLPDSAPSEMEWDSQTKRERGRQGQGSYTRGGPDIVLGGTYDLPDRPDSGRSPPQRPIIEELN
ncbi:hypothetical protein FSARC_11366 [Fusarium sarcochroum]|uniref:Uncharacterized protein n=1 Tax=Fusarium sarcochroum TaxID=1208366 RepID=A0A8H4TFX1_9HYPO|nr:hypothetical protein FSARC_11366 [Fusarium sarcochroum]